MDPEADALLEAEEAGPTNNNNIVQDEEGRNTYSTFQS